MNNFIKGRYRIRLFPKREYEQNLEWFIKECKHKKLCSRAVLMIQL